MLERWRKNVYFGDGYFLSKSFWVRLAQINRLISRASQIALEAATPSSVGYDWGMHFRRRACQGCQKLARIKLLVDNMLREKAMSIIQENFIKIAVKDEKTSKQRKRPLMSWLLLPPLYSKSGGKTVNAASFKKALTTSLTIFKPKSPILLSQGRFLWRGEETDSVGVSFRNF